MGNRRFLFAALAILAVGLLVPTITQANNVVDFGESGNMIITLDTGGKVVVPGVLRADPLNFGTVTLSYSLSTLTPLAVLDLSLGDVIIHEGSLTGPISDILRFEDLGAGGGHTLFVYSDFEGSVPGSPPDIGIPTPPFQPNSIDVLETGLPGQPYSDDNNGLFGYTPTSNSPNEEGQPGFISVGINNPIPPLTTYNFTSDTLVPEPTTLVGALTGFVLVGAGVVSRRRRA